MVEPVVPASQVHAELCRDRLTHRLAETERLSNRLHRYVKHKKIIIFGVVGYAVLDQTATIILVPLFIMLMPAVLVQNRIGRKLDRAYRAAEFYRHAVARIDDRWIGDGDTGEHYLDDDEVFADDLDLFGNGSLFQFLCATRTSIGDDTLAAWLTQPADAGEILERQSAVRELAAKLDLRERLALLELDGRSFQPHAVVEWTRAPELLPNRSARVTGLILAAALAGVILGGSGLSIWFITGAVVLEVGFYAWFRRRLRPISSHGSSAVATLSFLSSVRSTLGNSSFESRRLAEIQQKVAAVPSRLCAVYAFFAQLPPLLLLLCQFVPGVDRWRRSHAKPAEEGLLAFGELEAIASLAQYTFIRPEATFPKIVETETCYDAIELGHPLIRENERIKNDLQLNGDLQLLLVSGSNMSGKSTMLRTVGVNAVLALCGAPVCAKQFCISPLSIGTAMRFQDSLEHRTSHFYAVITRLRRVLDVQDGDRPLLFLIDEILQGTNSRDRIHGAEALVRRLIERGGVGMVTTHDLELTRIVDTLDGRAANVHFVDKLVDDEIHFDYKMRPGVVQSSNALALMRKMGLDV